MCGEDENVPGEDVEEVEKRHGAVRRVLNRHCGGGRGGPQGFGGDIGGALVPRAGARMGCNVWKSMHAGRFILEYFRKNSAYTWEQHKPAAPRRITQATADKVVSRRRDGSSVSVATVGVCVLVDLDTHCRGPGQEIRRVWEGAIARLSEPEGAVEGCK